MNFISKKWIKTKNINLINEGDKLILENKSDKHGFVIIPKIYKYKKENYRIVFKGESLKGVAPTLKFINRKKVVQAEFEFNTESEVSFEFLKYYGIIIYVPENSSTIVTELIVDSNIEKLTEEFKNHFKSDTLVITPGYPSDTNKYNTAFVHTRVKNYIENGLDVDVAVINSLPGKTKYTFDGVEVIKGDFYFLRELLSKRKFRRILVHFFDSNYGNVFENVDLTETNLYFYLHGADVLYRDYPAFATPYFSEELEMNPAQSNFKKSDYFFNKYNEMDNVKWIFVSNFVKERAEELNHIKFKNYDIIPCYIDEKLFKYQKKKPDLRKKVFILRKFTNDKCYAIDIDVRAILELSRRECFKDMEFDIYGSGPMFEILTNPLKKFENVRLHSTFLTHKEIKEVHDNHGIALFASRFDTQGVSLGEAAASGCAVVTSNISAINSYIDPELGVNCDVENYVEYADVIEKMYNNPDYFEKVSKSVAQSVHKKFSYKETIQKEIDMFHSEKKRELSLVQCSQEPVLTVIVPSYNVEKYLWNGIMTLMNVPNAHKLEILIVDDGSKDSTAKIGKNLEKISKVNGKSIVRLISKENGGHGSTINVGIQEARGKYIKIMDGDDTVDSLSFSKLIDILENEDTDIILNSYMEDYATLNVLNFKKVYDFMVPGLQYNFDDLCYPGYGFYSWGPILSCSTYKASMLKAANFKLSEKCFYVDMELNLHVSIIAKTVKFYPLYIYRYLLGRENQSVSRNSYMRNYKHHERVTMNLINILYENENNISKERRDYIVNRMILVMIKTQYLVCIDFYNNGKPFREFEKQLRNYEEFYNHPEIVSRAIKFHRFTHGFFIKFNSVLVKISRIFK